jgi:E3 ubiquitin-protein ligase MARCH6
LLTVDLVYAPEMPSTVPLFMFFKKLVEDTAKGMQFGVRFGLISVLWLFCLPLTVIYSFYVCTLVAESVPHNYGIFKEPVKTVIEYLRQSRDNSIIRLPSFMSDWIASDVVRDLSNDLVNGQVVILLLLLSFFIIMIVREWILQNDIFVMQLRQIAEQEARRGLQDDRERRLQFRQAMARELAMRIDPHNAALNPRMAQQHNLEEFQDVFNRLNVDVDERDPDDPFRLVARFGADQQQGEQQGPQEEREENENNDDQFQQPAPQPQQPGQPPLQQAPRDQGPAAAAAAAAAAANNPEDEEDPAGEEFEGILDFVGFRAPLVSLLATYSAATMVAMSVIFLVYLVPYADGRLTLTFARQAFTVIVFLGNEVFYFLAKAFVRIFAPSMKTSIYEEALNKREYFINSLSSAQGFPGTGFVYAFVSTVVGYGLFIFMAEYYANSQKRFARSHAGRLMERAVIQYIKQGEAILKVITVIGIELVVFPIYCGMLLSISLYPLFFYGGSFTTGVKLVLEHPITSTFFHWSIGTGYMFLFALFVSLCRSIMRPGVLYFVRDPNDPNFHPIRDVLERKLVSQLGKIGISAVIYSVLIVICIGGVIHSMSHLLAGELFPLKWIPSNDMEFPRGMLLAYINIMIPMISGRHRVIKKVIRKIWNFIFSKACHALRLSSFILKKPDPTEQGYVYYTSLWARICRVQPDYTNPVSLEEAKAGPGMAYFVPDGYFVRAPDTDSLPTKARLNLFIQVTKDDERLDGQEDEEDGGENELKRYDIVYRPPHFRLRIASLLGYIWFSGTLLVLCVTLFPLLAGKFLVVPLFTKVPLFTRTGSHMGDGVNYLAGLTILISMLHTYESIGDSIGVRMKQLAKATTSFSAILVKLLLVGSSLLLTTGLIGHCAELFFVVPAVEFYNDTTHIDILNHYILFGKEEATKGNLISFFSVLTGTSILEISRTTFCNLYPDHRVSQLIRQMRESGPLAIGLRQHFEYILVPILLTTISIILGPWTMGLAANFLIFRKSEPAFQLKVLRLAYPYSLAGIIGILLGIVLFRGFKRWEVSVRDEAYLVGEQLENM